MSNSAQEKKSKLGSTQKFTEIEDIYENIVVFYGKQACLILEVQATNFSLLSENERYAKIVAYGSLLNSLSFPIQILIRSKKINVLSYIKLLDSTIAATQNEQFKNYRKQYKDFIQELAHVNTLLDKKFYIVIPFNSLEASPTGMKQSDFITLAKAALHTKAESIMTQLARLALKATILEKEDLIKLFYDVYNEELDQTYGIDEVTKSPIVKRSNT